LPLLKRQNSGERKGGHRKERPAGKAETTRKLELLKPPNLSRLTPRPGIKPGAGRVAGQCPADVAEMITWVPVNCGSTDV